MQRQRKLYKRNGPKYTNFVMNCFWKFHHNHKFTQIDSDMRNTSHLTH